MLIENSFKPSKDDSNKIVESIYKDISTSDLPYNEKMKLLTDFPSLLKVLKENQWDTTLVNHVAHHHPEYFIYVPPKLVTKHIYETYLMNGARMLKDDFRPVHIDELIDLKTAVFMLRSCRTLTYSYRNHPKYITHMLKMVKRGENLSRCYAVPCIHRVLNNLDKYLGKNDHFDYIMTSAIFNSEKTIEKYGFDKIDEFVNFSDFILKKTVEEDNYVSSNFLVKKYQMSDEETKAKIVDIAFKLCYIETKEDLKLHGWQLEYNRFFKILLRRYITINLKLLDGTPVKLKSENWLLKKFKQYLEIYIKGKTHELT